MLRAIFKFCLVIQGCPLHFVSRVWGLTRLIPCCWPNLSSGVGLSSQLLDGEDHRQILSGALGLSLAFRLPGLGAVQASTLLVGRCRRMWYVGFSSYGAAAEGGLS